MLTGHHQPSPNERSESTGTAEPTAAPASTAASSGSGASARRGVPAWVLPVVLAAGWLAVVLSQLRPPTPSDQLNYMEAAARFPHPLETSTAMHQVTRFGLLLPMRLAIAVFGYSQAAYYVVPIIATLILLLGTYALGTQLFSRVAGVAAALVVVAATPVFADAADPLPDVLVAGLFTVAVSLALAIRRRRLPARWWVLVGLGLLLGWSYLVREFIVFVWPLIPILLWRRVGWRGLFLVAAPMAALFAGETLLCWALYGNPMARIHAVTHHAEGPAPIEIARTFRGKPRSTYILRLPKTLREYPEGNWMIAFIGLTLAGGAVWRRRLAVPVVWCALLWVPLTLLGGVLDPSAPKLRLQLIRYWFPIFPAFMLGGLGALWLAGRVLGNRLRDRPGGHRMAVALPVALVVTVAAATVGTAARGWWALPGSRAGGGTQLEAFRSWMSEHDQAAPRIWTDAHTARLLQIYQHGPFGGLAWHARIGRATPGHPGARPGDLVLFFDTESGRLCGRCRKSARQVWGPRPRPLVGWRQVYATGDGVVQVYQVLSTGPVR